jgi:hypothetical protein
MPPNETQRIKSARHYTSAGESAGIGFMGFGLHNFRTKKDLGGRKCGQDFSLTRIQAKHTGISLVRNERSDVLLHPFRREVCVFQPRIDAANILLARLEVSL